MVRTAIESEYGQYLRASMRVVRGLHGVPSCGVYGAWIALPLYANNVS